MILYKNGAPWAPENAWKGLVTLFGGSYFNRRPPPSEAPDIIHFFFWVAPGPQFLGGHGAPKKIRSFTYCKLIFIWIF